MCVLFLNFAPKDLKSVKIENLKNFISLNFSFENHFSPCSSHKESLNFRYNNKKCKVLNIMCFVTCLLQKFFS